MSWDNQTVADNKQCMFMDKCV